MAIHFPEPCGLSKAEVISLAHQVGNQLGYQPGADIEPIIARIGGRVHRVGADRLIDTRDGSIQVIEVGSFDIHLADDVGPMRERFTLAHELGHYCLHFEPEKGEMHAKRYGSDRTEWEANWFAAGFLMPEDEFKEAFERHEGNISAIASLFRVSPQAAELHAKYYNLT